MFDTRSPQGILSVDHGAPVESVLMFPGGGIFISAGKTLLLSKKFLFLSFNPELIFYFCRIYLIIIKFIMFAGGKIYIF